MPAAALAGTVDFDGHRRLLDIGGGIGSWYAAILRNRPHMTATVFEFPQLAEIAGRRIALANVRRAVEPGARLLLVDYWTDPTHTEPVIAPLMAGEFAVNIESGDGYSAIEACNWLAGTGWRFVAHQPFTDAKSVIITEPARVRPVPSGVRALTFAERRRYVWSCGMGGLPA